MWRHARTPTRSRSRLVGTTGRLPICEVSRRSGRGVDTARAESAGRIGILSANRPGVVFAVHAATRMSVPVVPLNWRQTAPEIAWQLRDAGITVLVVDEERATVAKAACAELPVTIVPIAELERLPPPDSSLHEPRRIDLEQEAAVIYTSGTSGRPKGARITNGNLWFSAIASALHLGHHLDDVWLAAMPLFHIGGLAILFRGVIGSGSGGSPRAIRSGSRAGGHRRRRDASIGRPGHAAALARCTRRRALAATPAVRASWWERGTAPASLRSAFVVASPLPRPTGSRRRPLK